jgi:O-antigen ligase
MLSLLRLPASAPAGSSAGSTPGVLFSGFAIALGMSVIAGFLSFLREPPSGDFHSEWGALVFFCCAAALVAPALPRRFGVNPLLLLLPAVLAGLLALHTALGMYAYWQRPVFWFGYLLLAVLAFSVGQGLRAAGLVSEVVNRIAWALVITALLNTGIQIVQAVQQIDEFAPFVIRLVKCRPYGNVGQSNQAATLAWLGLSSVLYLYACRRVVSPAALPMIALLLIGAALSGSRMNWLFLPLVAVAVVLLPAWPARDRRTRLMTAAMLAIGLVVATIGLDRVFEALGPGCVAGLDRVANRNETGIVVRLELWRQAIDVWLTSPWIGVGAYGFSPTVYAIESLDVHRPLDIYVHNAVLQILAEFGLIGAGALLAVAGVLVAWLVSARRQLVAPDALLLVLMGVIGVHSMLEFPLWYTYFLMPFCLAAGLLVRHEWWPRAAPQLPRLAVLGVACTMLAASGWLFQDYRKLDRVFWLEEYRRHLSAGPTEEIRALLGGAADDVVLFAERADHFAGLSEPINRDDLQRKISSADRLMRHGTNPAIMGRRIALAILDEDPETARWHLRRMLGFFPADAEQLTEPLRYFVKHRPEEFAALGPILDEELARMPAPRRR